MSTSETYSNNPYDPTSAHPVGAQLASSAYDLLLRMNALGMVITDNGAVIPPEVQKAMEALFVVLAGGNIKVDVTQRGNPDIIAELKTKLATAIADSNAINGAAGTYLVASA